MTKEIIKILLIFAVLLVPYTVTATDVIKGGVGVHIGPTTPRCGNLISSCGTYPNCANLTDVSYCINGRVVKPYCYGNAIQNRTYNQACTEPIAVNLQLNVTNDAGSQRQLVLTLYKPGKTDIINTASINGYGSISSIDPVADFKFEFDSSNLNVVVKNLNLTQLSSEVSKIIIDKPSPTISGVDVYKAYRVELPPDFSFSTISLTMSYSNVNVRNEANLRFYKCSSFNAATNICNGNWLEITSINKNTTNKIVSTEINSFSVYTLGEPSQQNTTNNTCDSNSWSNCDCDCGECGSCQGIRENGCGTTQSCTAFCGYCSSGYTCVNNLCYTESNTVGSTSTPVVVVCGNGACETGEDSSNCCKDCGCPSGETCDATANACYTEVQIDNGTGNETNLTAQAESNNKTNNSGCPSVSSGFSLPLVALLVPSAAAAFFATRWYYVQRIEHRHSYSSFSRRFKSNSKYSFRKSKYNSGEIRLAL
jgi:hypothetical protein